jgi:hypothetical protein
LSEILYENHFHFNALKIRVKKGANEEKLLLLFLFERSEYFPLELIFHFSGESSQRSCQEKICDNRKKFQFVINDFVVREHDVSAECEINGLLQNFILK